MTDSNTLTKKRVGILFGGKSAEHEVSLNSARNVVEALDKELFEPILIAIDDAGAWRFDADGSLLKQSKITAEDLEGEQHVTLTPNGGGSLIAVEDGTHVAEIDIIFPVVHGPTGEDGVLQGFLESAGLPYVGSGVLASAVGMDKAVAKRLFREAGIPITDFVVVKRHQLSTLNVDEVVERLGLPLFVKPANMGSSVGVSKVTEQNGVMAALEEAFLYDTKALIEKAVDGDEIECAVLGNEVPSASAIGRILTAEGDYYSYGAKYIDTDDAILEIPADISHDVAQKAQAIALQAYDTLDCEGLSRIDMFVTKDGTILINEVNTIPGFTSISMFPKLWEVSGIYYADLITRLIELAEKRHRVRQALRTHR